MKFISWNLNGIRAAVRHGLVDFIRQESADFYCFQETKYTDTPITQIPQIDQTLEDYYIYYHPAEKKGYSGVAVFTKKKPLKVIYGLNDKKIDREGRVITLEYDKFYLINAYFPQAGRELKRLDFKLYFDQKFLQFCQKLHNLYTTSEVWTSSTSEVKGANAKPLIIAGDFNVAHQEIDLAHPKENQGNAMFTKEERTWMDKFLKTGFVDSFRLFNKDGGHYTWWIWRANARKRNLGWRIDYFLVSAKLKSRVKNSFILNKIYGSDHCPISLEV